jgi:hypothetical protein
VALASEKHAESEKIKYFVTKSCNFIRDHAGGAVWKESRKNNDKHFCCIHINQSYTFSIGGCRMHPIKVRERKRELERRGREIKRRKKVKRKRELERRDKEKKEGQTIYQLTSHSNTCDMY